MFQIKLLKNFVLGYKLIDELFCDSSGFGSENEPALTESQMYKKISKSNSRLSKEDILNIFDMYENNNITYSEIGDIYKLNTSSVWAILNKVSYKWVWG
jgi:hypothetical protein